ncbi:DUF2167 domain-containing protein [Clostridium sp. OS1-26]|uniref:DUF2167 domain-containing protein n=1 Tax=Clostridium sp. OS1-26 TaxID=3070681 RepID=UPI0027E03071|nr:DUF2167 domain-containing protein [Clostridium sp. OS1-26]WML33927.1 DUF2167 domain-containing protein [Clostridium sp. OS1-26]
MYKKLSYLLLILISIVFNTHHVYANNTAKPDIKWIEGPKTVDVGSDLAKLDLPDEYVFANGEDAKKLMKQMDNSVTGREQGIVFSKDTKQNWFVLFEFDPIGYVRDNDAKKINADKLLEEIKKGTEKDNEKRKQKGTPTLDIIGWDEKPHYDDKSHNLVWSVLSNSEGEKIVNYNVRILGRGGVTEVTLVAGKDEMEKVKPQLDTIISKYSYKEGKKYTDYIKGDKVSELGLTALIAGGAGAAAAKTGLLAKLLLIFKKIWIVVILGIGGLFKKIISKFKKKSSGIEENTSNIDANNLINSNMETAEEISATSSDLEKKKD